MIFPSEIVVNYKVVYIFRRDLSLVQDTPCVDMFV